MKAILFLLAGSLAGCQSWQAGPDTSAGSSGVMGSGTASGNGQEAAMSDHEAACQMSRRITGARTPEAREALMDQTMQGMSADARDEQLVVMHKQCERILH